MYVHQNGLNIELVKLWLFTVVSIITCFIRSARNIKIHKTNIMCTKVVYCNNVIHIYVCCNALHANPCVRVSPLLPKVSSLLPKSVSGRSHFSQKLESSLTPDVQSHLQSQDLDLQVSVQTDSSRRKRIV